MTKGKSKKSRKNRKALLTAILSLAGVLIIGGSLIGYKYYRMIYNENVTTGNSGWTYLYIPTGADFSTVTKLMSDQHLLKDPASFAWLAEKKGYTTRVKPGKYRLTDGMTNNNLINLLRSGEQEAVQFTFKNFRTKQQIAGKAGAMLEADSSEIAQLLFSDSLMQATYGLNSDEVLCLFIPNTYELWWNTSASGFSDRMYKEYTAFWNDQRKQKAQALGLKPQEVIILASIVDQETKQADEMSRVAGVYMNRIRKGMLLQADPTVIFAIGDFTINRVLNKHLTYDSPYNTYRYKGLPPGPICTPAALVIDKVLDCENHDYIYFCAKEDFSGHHNFAKTLAQHQENARRYQQALTVYLHKKDLRQPIRLQ